MILIIALVSIHFKKTGKWLFMIWYTLLAFVVIWHIYKHYEMKHEITQWKCFVQTHLLFVTIYGLVWSSSVTFKHKMMLVHFNVSLVIRHHFYLVMNKQTRICKVPMSLVDATQQRLNAILMSQICLFQQ